MRLISARVPHGGRMVLIAIALLIAVAQPSQAAAKLKRGPINAKVTVDRKRVVSAQITVAAGGSIVVRTRNGTRVTVKFPPGAVLSDTRVSAAPVTGLSSRVTRKGLLAGIQLAPEGLQLLKPATVQFARRGRAPGKTRLVFVGSEGNGRDLYRLPPPVRSRGRGAKRRFVPTGRPVVSIDHFSTVDAFDWSNATLEDIDAILRPAMGVHRMSQEMSTLLQDKNATPQDFQDLYDREYKRFIDPLLKVASAGLRSCSSVASIRRAQNAMATAGSITRGFQLLGVDTGNVVATHTEMLTATALCMQTLCPKSGDPRASGFFLVIAHQLALLGGGSPAFFDALYENMERCGAFEVRIDSRIDVSGPELNWSYRVVGRAKVLPSVFGRLPPARGPLEYTVATGSSPSFCVVVTVPKTTNGEFEVSEVSLTDFDPDRPTSDPVRSLRISIPVQPTETLHGTPTGGEGCPTTTDPDFSDSLWFRGFQAGHPEFTFPGADFVRDAPPVFALATYGPRTTNIGAGAISENTLVEIVHTPLPPVPLPDPTPEQPSGHARGHAPATFRSSKQVRIRLLPFGSRPRGG